MFKNANGYNINTVAADGTLFAQVDGVTASAANTNVTLDTGAGTVTQSAGKLVRTDTGNAGATGGLELKGTAAYTLTDTGNNVATLAVNATNVAHLPDEK